jgi:diguanylate cyclase (GGDEF)-like protein
MRITRKVFNDLAIFMVGFGLCMGLVFPPFMLVLGIPQTYVFTFPFYASCIAAGIAVGAINIFLARTVVGKRLRMLSDKMQYIGDRLTHARTLGDLQECDSDECRLPVDSHDELGESAHAYNTLLSALSDAISSEAAVHAFNTLMASQLELEMLAKTAVDYLRSYCGAKSGCIVIERGGEFTIPYCYGITDSSALLANDHLYKLFESKSYEHIELADQITIDGLLVAYKPKEVHVAPLFYKEVPIGLLILASDTLIDRVKLQTVELLNQSFSIALNNAITYDQLQKLAANDPLTGLYNRRFGMNRLAEEYVRSVRSHSPLGILLFDIDHFKRVNDTYGHTAGDRVLINIAKISAMAARKGDLLIRYGGEEFVIILPGAGKEDCLFVAERLRHMVEESVVAAGDAKIQVTVSIGAVSYPEYACENEIDLIKIADKALYIAKDKGRNAVVSY